MKHLLVLTDFSIQSLNTVHAAIAHYKDDMLKITLFHLLEMPGDIAGLLFPSMRNKHLSMETPEFKEACEILHNRYTSRISSIKVEFGFGSTVAYIENMLEGEGIDRVVVCSDIKLTFPSKCSIDALPLLKRTRIPLDTLEAAAIRRQHADINAISMANANELKIPRAEKRYAIEK